MKKSLLLLISLFFFQSHDFAQIRSDKDLIGKWESSNLRLEFFADGRVGLIMHGGTMPGATYKADFFKNPVVLEITVTQNSKKLVFKAHADFRDNSTIELEGYDENDPAAPFRRGRTITLKKVK